MTRLRSSWVSCLACAVLGCLGSSRDSGPPINETVSGIHVDATAGNDATGDGRPGTPFRTLTRGLAAARPRQTVRIWAGRYGGGEAFPIVVPRQVSVQADAGAELEGAGPYWSPALEGTVSVGIVAGAGSRIASLRIRAPGGVAVWSEDAGGPAELVGAALVDSDYGVVFAGTVETSLAHSAITGHAKVGIEVIGDARPVVRHVEVASNPVGVVIRERAHPDLGTTAFPGENRFAGNTGCDLANETGNVVQARGNAWDVNPYLITAVAQCVDGADVVNAAPGGAVLVQDVPPGTGPVFPGAAVIGALSPAAGAVVASPDPDLSWTPTGASLVVAGVFSVPIAVTGRRIGNGGDMVWAWHTGLRSGREGAVSFADGVRPVGGRLDLAGPPVPLQRGQTYYWAVWAWDEQGTQVVSASALAFFTVLN